MKKFIDLKCFAFLIIGIICWNCQEKRIGVTEVIEIKSLFSDVDMNSVYQNPYDTIGRYHNIGMDEIFKMYFENPKTRASEDEKKDLLNLVCVYAKKNPFMNNIAIDRNEVLKIGRSIQTRSNTEPENEYIIKLGNIFKEKDISSPQSLITKINQFEKEIAELSLSEEEKAQLLSTTAVAKYSSLYWMEKFSTFGAKTRSFDPDDPDSSPPINEEEWEMWMNVLMGHIVDVVMADYEGAFEGGAMGFIIGISGGTFIAPGIGIVTGAIYGMMHGAVLGSLGASLFRGVDIIWNIIFGD